MLDLTNCTFIIPVKIDSADRAFNFQYVIGYLCKNLNTNIIIYEQDSEQKAYHLLKRINKYNTPVKYFFDQKKDNVLIPFHRTKLLNEMLAEVNTAVVVNYDTDVILKPSTYMKAYEAILAGVDLCYPFFFGESQIMINRPKMTDDLTEPIQQHVPNQAQYGHVQFFNTDSYRRGGMENEGFVSYGPEDQERCYRFQTLGYNVTWLDGCYVYHLEHSRGHDSNSNNFYFEANVKLFDHIKSLTYDQLNEYYLNADYIKKYKRKMISFLTYSDKNYRVQQDRLMNRAKELGVADQYTAYTREQLVETQFYKENKAILDLPKGAGYWAWKPFIIMEELAKMPPESIVVYLDSGDFINNDFNQFLQRKMRNCDLLLTLGGFPNRQYTKRDCFVMMGADNDAYYDDIQVEAGIIVVKNTPSAIATLKEWQKWCLVPEVVTDMPNKHGKNLPEFIEHRWDQSILSIMKLYYELPCTQEMRQFVECNVND